MNPKSTAFPIPDLLALAVKANDDALLSSTAELYSGFTKKEYIALQVLIGLISNAKGFANIVEDELIDSSLRIADKFIQKS
jgi:hypothetical protein